MGSFKFFPAVVANLIVPWQLFKIYNVYFVEDHPSNIRNITNSDGASQSNTVVKFHSM